MRNTILSIFLFISVNGFPQNIPSVKIEELACIIDTSKAPLVINFWATWCAPCVHEIPWFEKQVKSFKKDGARLILVSLDFAEDYPAKLKAFVKQNKYTSQVLWLNETNADVFCPRIDESWEGGLPATLFVNKSKNYRRFIGSQITGTQLKTELQALIKGQSKNNLAKGLILDLDADTGVHTAESNKVESWDNKAPGAVMKTFVKRDEGRKVPGSGRPQLKEKIKELNGHNSVVFLKQELLNMNEEGCDALITGNGFTWICVIKPYTQVGLLQDVNSFFGSLKNGGNYEGFWAGFTDDNRFWAGARNGITFGRWDNNNPFIVTPASLDTTQYYLLAGRMGAGTGTVQIELFVNDLQKPAATGDFPVNTKADGSMLSIGQERDAIQHPGVESFNGEIARLLMFDRPLTDKEMEQVSREFKQYYGLKDKSIN